jgi:hypothetical protein
MRIFDRLRKRQSKTVMSSAPRPPVVDRLRTPTLPEADDDAEQLAQEIEYLRTIEARLVRLQARAEARFVRINHAKQYD